MGPGKGPALKEQLRGWGRRVLWLLIPGVAVYYLTFGGEYSVFDVRELEESRDGAVIRLDSLQAVVDSLTAWADSLTADTLAIERLARERYGFIRDGDVLYRFVDPGEEQGDRPGVDRAEVRR